MFKKFVYVLLVFCFLPLFVSLGEEAKKEVKKAELKKLPTFMDFGAHQCQACKKMTPILEELTKEYPKELQVIFVDVWVKENAEKAKEFKIKQIPTQIFLDSEGKELWRHIGFISKKEILAKWNELGIKLTPAKPTEKKATEKKDTEKTQKPKK